MAKTEGANVTVDFDHGQLERLFDELDVVAVVGYGADYAAYVEFPTEYTGTQPPFDPIYDWVVRKWADLDEGLKESVVPESGNITKTEQQKKVAWKVVGAIADSGTDGVFMLNRGFEAAKKAGREFLKEFEDSDDIEAARKAITRTVDFAFETSQDVVADEASDRGTLLQSGFVIVTRDGEDVFEKEGNG